MGPTKLRYFVNFGIASYFKYILIESIKQSLRHIVSFEESLNDMTQSCEMDRYSHTFDEIDCQVKVRYYDFHFFGHGTSKDIQNQFKNAISRSRP